MEVPRGVDLGAQHGRETLRRERFDHTVVQHTGGVHDAAHLVLLQHLLQRLAVTDIARDHGDLGVQIGHVRLAGAAHQHEFLDAVAFDQVPGDHPSQPTGPAGDQHRPGELAGLRSLGPREPCREHLTAAHPQLRFVDRENLLCHLTVGVDEREPAGVLVLRGPDQTVHRTRGEIALARHEHQPLGPLLGDPALHQFQRTCGESVRPLDDVPVAGELLHHHSGRTRIGQRHRHPVEPEQRIPLDSADLLGHRARHQRPDRRHGRTRRVRDRDLPRVPVAPQPDPDRSRTDGVQRHAFPRERQPRLGAVEEPAGVQRGVEQRRVQPERSSVHAFGQRDLGEHLAVRAPHGPQPLEHRPVLEPVLREAFVSAVDLNGLSTSRRPHRGIEVAADGTAGQEPGRVPRPRHVLTVRPREHLDRAPPVLLGTDRDLDPDRPLLRQHERRGQRQLLDAVQPDLVPGPHRELQERGAGQQHLPGHPVVREPRVRAQRQPAREQVPVRPGNVDRRSEQRVFDPGEPQRPGVTGLAHRLRPEHLVLERVGGQINLPSTAVQPRPVNIDSVNMYLTECSQH
ncbi:hypothetical protein GCM10010178_24750 [Lentzea flava]|uniref:Uncharacterized protein n=1 Tax=Lentzea flava TaxID=103732 RepID=A0ABQ2UIA9_9PSEU|nr:hypothetical protein GCM10010178_24750 [Lentzea flava]